MAHVQYACIHRFDSVAVVVTKCRRIKLYHRTDGCTHERIKEHRPQIYVFKRYAIVIARLQTAALGVLEYLGEVCRRRHVGTELYLVGDFVGHRVQETKVAYSVCDRVNRRIRHNQRYDGVEGVQILAGYIRHKALERDLVTACCVATLQVRNTEDSIEKTLEARLVQPQLGQVLDRVLDFLDGVGIVLLFRSAFGGFCYWLITHILSRRNVLLCKAR